MVFARGELASRIDDVEEGAGFRGRTSLLLFPESLCLAREALHKLIDHSERSPRSHEQRNVRRMAMAQDRGRVVEERGTIAFPEN